MSKHASRKQSQIEVDHIVSRARTMKPAARADFLRRHTASEIAEIHEAVVGEAKPRTPRPILEKRILHALAADTPQPAHLDQDRNVLVADHQAAIDAAAPLPTPDQAPAVANDEGLPAPDPAPAADKAAVPPNADDANGGATADDVGAAAADHADGADVGAEGANHAPSDAAPAGPATPERELPPVGTVVIKNDRHGKERVRCQIVEGGVLYAGTTYTSLSAAAIAAARDLGLTTKTLNGWSWWGLASAARSATPRAKKGPADALAQLFERYRDKAAAALAEATDDDRAQLQGAIREHLTAHTALAGEAA